MDGSVAWWKLGPTENDARESEVGVDCKPLNLKAASSCGDSGRDFLRSFWRRFWNQIYILRVSAELVTVDYPRRVLPSKQRCAKPMITIPELLSHSKTHG